MLSDETTGGSEWELAEAIKLMGSAQASGDPEQIATAMRRHAEALTNATNTTMIPTLRNVLETVLEKEVGALARRIDATVQQQDQRFGYMLNQMGAHLEKEDARHDRLAQSEDATLDALTSVARRLDEITSYVQQSVTLSREANDRARRSEATATESLAATRVVTAELVELKKAVIVLKEGQSEADDRLDAVIRRLDQLGALAEKTNSLAEEHNRLAKEQNRLTTVANDLARKVADLEAWRMAVEARGTGNGK